MYDLYVVTGEENSQKALRYPHVDVHTHDVRQMKEIPTFLKGVPSLYIRKSKLVMTGSQCLQFLQSLEPPQVEEEEMMQSSIGGKKSNFVSQAPPREYSDEKIKSLDLEKILQERNNQFK